MQQRVQLRHRVLIFYDDRNDRHPCFHSKTSRRKIHGQIKKPRRHRDTTTAPASRAQNLWRIFRLKRTFDVSSVFIVRQTPALVKPIPPADCFRQVPVHNIGEKGGTVG